MEQGTTKPIYLYPIDFEIVKEIQNCQHRSFSGAVQFIIRDYKRLVSQSTSSTAEPVQKGKRQ